MKKIILIIICFSFISCSAQMKLNKSKEIDILINTPWKFGENNNIHYTIKNKSNKTYVVDPYGFSGDSYWLFNNEKLNPIDRSRGYYTRHTDEDCKGDLIIIKPKHKIDIALSLNYSEKGIYDLSKPGKYIWNIKSNHSKKNDMPLTCKSYIITLEKKGYIMLEDSIVAKIPFIR
ncbi:hypothetical protein [Chryseobacterium jejuense]|uniref:Gliding motility-associated lipoprotein GldH n=1 Tax=Chryseobacterium jejuense TaxID=445960 RepID=A0A2X2X5K3_CHRJE|nr:hypothetical protein [Chryseobacterium jejuense]SDJ32062.1 hypothetical protein SAMN05421542_3175 [Chryseobacterium jejuense]SQB45383.1 Uncharacterised protein [Chryseobacterium jejuense]